MTTEQLIKDEIIPDVLDEFDPEQEIKVTYNSKSVLLGNVMTVKETQQAPTVFWEAEDDALYTLIMTDPDAPSRKNPMYREWCHWVVCNIPGMEIKKGAELMPYMGPSPPKGTGLHRYIFVLYKQPKKISTRKIKDRPNWKVKEFAKKNNLGDPIAVNYFQARQK